MGNNTLVGVFVWIWKINSKSKEEYNTEMVHLDYPLISFGVGRGGKLVDVKNSICKTIINLVKKWVKIGKNQLLCNIP